MLLMASSGLGLAALSEEFADRPFWRAVGRQVEHSDWVGCTLWDLIQPAFMFMVGVALPFSMASRRVRGQGFPAMLSHAMVRSLTLVLLAVFLSSAWSDRTNWVFTNVLAQVGLGYPFLFLLASARARIQWIAAGGILLGYWLLFALAPVAGSGFDWEAVGVLDSWPHLTGFAAHWDKNSNPAYAFEQWLYQYLPRANQHNSGGYATLSFIPTLATMTLGLIAGSWLRSGPKVWLLVGGFVLVGGVLLAAGYGLDYLGVCPSVKRIWTPSWVLFSGGWCFLLLALFLATTDAIGRPGWSYPLRVIGANSIVAYCLAEIPHVRELIVGTDPPGFFRTHFGPSVFQLLGKEYEPFVSGVVLLAVWWLLLWWMYRNRVFVRL